MNYFLPLDFQDGISGAKTISNGCNCQLNLPLTKRRPQLHARPPTGQLGVLKVAMRRGLKAEAAVGLRVDAKVGRVRCADSVRRAIAAQDVFVLPQD